MNLGDIWGAVDKPKRKKPESSDSSNDAAWVQWHMNRIRDWMKEGIGLTHDDTKIMQILGCGGSEYDDLISNRPNYFTLQRIKAIHNNLTALQRTGEA